MSGYPQEREQEEEVRRWPVRGRAAVRVGRVRGPIVRFRTPLVRRTFGRRFVQRGRYARPWIFGSRASPVRYVRRSYVPGVRPVGWRASPSSWIFRGASAPARIVRPWIYRGAPRLPWIFGSYPWPAPPPPVVAAPAEPVVAEPAPVPPPEDAPAPPEDAAQAAPAGDAPPSPDAGDAPPEGEYEYRSRWARRRARWGRRRRLYGEDEYG